MGIVYSIEIPMQYICSNHAINLLYSQVTADSERKRRYIRPENPLWDPRS